MRYNIHLWQLDETGHWTKYAVGRKPDGSVTNERDTEATNPPLTLIDARFGFGIPTAETARLTISVFNGIVRELLPTAETRKTVNESGGINIDAALSLLNPTPQIQGGDTFAEGMGGCFISALLSYPRFIMPGGAIEIGGVDYLDLWQDNKPLPHNRFTTPEEILAEERRKCGGFDETVAAFYETVRWIGESTRTSKAARCVMGKVNALVRAFASLGFDDILRIDQLANETSEALQAMCDELADRKDAQPTTAQAVDGDKIALKVADVLKPILKPIADDAHGAKTAAEQTKDTAEGTQTIVKAHMTPRPTDYQVTQDQLSGMLSARNCQKSRRTIIRWEKYLCGDLKNGTKPPEGYTLQTRLTLQSVNAFLDFYCPNEKSKLNTRISYDALTSGRSGSK